MALQRTLRAWGIGVRASRLVPADDFAAALHAALPRLEGLEPLAIDSDLPADIADRLWSLSNSLGIVQNSAKIVAGTKTLHHLLPDLVVPMDRGLLPVPPAGVARFRRPAPDFLPCLHPVR